MRKVGLKSASTEQINVNFDSKRCLEWVPLAPPDYVVEPSVLIDRFIERECVYVGTLTDVCPPRSPVDLGRRSELLGLIDSGHLSKRLGCPSVKSIVSVCAQHVKVTGRLSPEALIMRIPLENIISVAYVRDNALHYIVVLYIPSISVCGTSNYCLTVIATETHIKAEEICSLITQCFQILYTEATLRNFDRQIYSTISHSGCDYSPLEKNMIHDKHSIENQSKYEHDSVRTFNEIESVYSELSASKIDLLQNYMVQLQQVLNQEEMKEFATSLAAWQKGSPFESFCRKTKNLLGPHRIGLLADMRYFIDPADKFTLEQFINDFNSPTKSNPPHGRWSQLLAKSPLPFPIQRSISYASTSNGVLSIYDEENSLRDDLSSPLKNNNNNNNNNIEDDEFAKNIDSLFQKVGDLDLILSSDR